MSKGFQPNNDRKRKIMAALIEASSKISKELLLRISLIAFINSSLISASIRHSGALDTI
jgi:hypothetical protein